MTVHRFLVTADEGKLWDFHIAVCSMLNLIKRRGQTLLYTCLEEHRHDVVEFAVVLGVTVQEIHGAGKRETYETIVDHGPGWNRKEKIGEGTT